MFVHLPYSVSSCGSASQHISVPAQCQNQAHLFVCLLYPVAPCGGLAHSPNMSQLCQVAVWTSLFTHLLHSGVTVWLQGHTCFKLFHLPVSHLAVLAHL